MILSRIILDKMIIGPGRNRNVKLALSFRRLEDQKKTRIGEFSITEIGKNWRSSTVPVPDGHFVALSSRFCF